MNDYSQMSDAELSRRVAELRGFAAELRNGVLMKIGEHTEWDGMKADDYGFSTGYALLNPGGELTNGDGYPTLDEAWQDAPDYASDLNAAAELLREMEVGVKWYPRLMPLPDSRWMVEVDDYDGNYWVAATPARAVCLAWLQWREGQTS